MDFEKKYNEALERAKYVLHTAETAGCAMHKDLLTEIFPELRESEDERIRRTLVEFFGPEVQLDLVRGVPIQKIRDWLEKQKEQKPIFKKGDKVIWDDEEFNILDVNETEYNVGGYCVPFSRQNELHPIGQKPAEIDFEDWDTLGYIRDIVRKHVRRDEEFNVLDKWLTEHYVNQKPAEWSEEDEKAIERAIDCVRAWEVDYCDGDNTISERLKSLRPQPHWKPSEQEKRALLNPSTNSSKSYKPQGAEAVPTT